MTTEERHMTPEQSESKLHLGVAKINLHITQHLSNSVTQ